MKLTGEEAIRQHRKMWRWIAEETEKQKKKVEKGEYFDAMGIAPKDIPLLHCYCCEYARIDGTVYRCCELCPISWDGANSHCCSKDSSYRSWADTSSWRVAAKAARVIAGLPEREE